MNLGKHNNSVRNNITLELGSTSKKKKKKNKEHWKWNPGSSDRIGTLTIFLNATTAKCLKCAQQIFPN
jgi:hypothetical protein